MRLQMRLPEVKPGEYPVAASCPYEGCGGGTSNASNCAKAVVDPDVRFRPAQDQSIIQRQLISVGARGLRGAVEDGLHLTSERVEKATNQNGYP